LRADASQLFAVHFSKPFEHAPALCRKAQVDLAPVLGRRLSRDQSLAAQPVDQADGAVVPDHEVLCQVVDGDALALRAGAQGEQRLILLGGDATLLGLDLRKAQESAQRTAERRELLVLMRVELRGTAALLRWHCHPAYRVS